MRTLMFWAVLALSLLTAGLASRPPAPVPATAPATAFSAERAFETVEAIGRTPHPTGSAEAARVRAEIAGRLRALGLRVEIHAGTGIAQVKWLAGSAAAARVENIVATLPGLDPSLPALALMAHSDSVPNSPGAADDSAGVAAALETARALRSGPPPRRDIRVVITDAEENGLIGAEAFFSTDPVARRLAAVINMDVRGSSGRALMFETGPDAGGWTELYRHAAVHPAANSLMAVVYHHLPNGTDFTQALGAGFPGLNLAFSGRQFDYHTAHATSGALDRGSLQHMGEQALGVARAIADAPVLPTPKPDEVYFDHPLWSLMGGGLIAYPAATGWALIVVELGLLAAVGGVAFRRGLAQPLGAGLGAVTLIGMTLAAALGLELCAPAFGSGYSDLQQRYAALGRYPWAFAAASLVAFALALGVLRLARGRARPWSPWLGALALLVGFSAAAQALAPTAAWALTIPTMLGLLGAACALALGGETDRPGPLAAIALTAWLGASMAFGLGQLVFSTVGVDQPFALAAVVPLAAATLLPLAAGEGGLLGAPVPTTALVLGLVSLAAAAGAKSSAAAPALTEAFYLAEPAAGRFERATALKLDPWTRETLAADGGAITRRAEPPLFSAPIQVAAAKPIVVDPVRLSAERRGDRVLLRIIAAPGAREVRLRLKASAPARDVAIDGRPATLLQGTSWQRLSFAAPPAAGFTFAFTPAARSRLEVAALEIIDGWPLGAKVPPRPPTLQPFGFSGATLVVSRAAFAW